MFDRWDGQGLEQSVLCYLTYHNRCRLHSDRHMFATFLQLVLTNSISLSWHYCNVINGLAPFFFQVSSAQKSLNNVSKLLHHATNPKTIASGHFSWPFYKVCGMLYRFYNWRSWLQKKWQWSRYYFWV